MEASAIAKSHRWQRIRRCLIIATVALGMAGSLGLRGEKVARAGETSWSGPIRIGGGPLGGPPVGISWGLGHEDLFWRGTDNRLWHVYMCCGLSSWSAPMPLGGSLAGDPHLISWGPGHIDVFFKGTDGHLWHIYYCCGSGWSPPLAFNSPALASDPFPVSWGEGHIDVFWRGVDGNLWHVFYCCGAGWRPAGTLGGSILGGTPHPVTWGVGHIDVFWASQDGNLWHIYYCCGNGWSGDALLGPASLHSEPIPVSRQVGAIDVFWAAADRSLWHDEYSSGWAGPAQLSPANSVAPGSDAHPVRSAPGVVDVVWRDPNSDVRQMRYVPGGWTGVSALGLGPVNSDPRPVSIGSGWLDVVWEGTDANVWHAPFHAAATLPTPVFTETHPLSCEAAALQAALATKGVQVSQDWILGQIGADLRAPVLAGSGPVRWGDPFQTFVGDVNGSETNFTGYGVYAPPIAAAARAAGRGAFAMEGWDPWTVVAEVAAGNPVVIWTVTDFSAGPTSAWTAWNGRAIPYRVGEHAVTVYAVDAAAGTISVDDDRTGTYRTFTMAQFQALFSVFGNMAVAVI